VKRYQALQEICGLLAITCLSLCLPNAVAASPSARLQASFTPERLGHGTTVGFAFEIAAPADQVPPPLTHVEVSYPVNLGLALSELGLATCTKGQLETFGPAGCPANSLMGYGTVLAEIAIGTSILRETAHVIVFRTPNYDGHLALLIYAKGNTPVSAHVVFRGIVFPASAPFGGRLDVEVPLVPSLPEAPDVAVVGFNSTLGPLHVRYHEHIHGRVVSYQPRGIPLPRRCPPGGFPFSTKFSFLDGSNSTARTTVRCPS
jgi:hypothetical protein